MKWILTSLKKKYWLFRWYKYQKIARFNVSFNNESIQKILKFSMTPIFKCLICKRDIERSTKSFWVKKGHLLCSTCLDNIEQNEQKNPTIKSGLKDDY